jgi:hypothetical protein
VVRIATVDTPAVAVAAAVVAPGPAVAAAVATNRHNQPSITKGSPEMTNNIMFVPETKTYGIHIEMVSGQIFALTRGKKAKPLGNKFYADGACLKQLPVPSSGKLRGQPAGTKTIAAWLAVADGEGEVFDGIDGDGFAALFLVKVDSGK